MFGIKRRDVILGVILSVLGNFAYTYINKGINGLGEYFDLTIDITRQDVLDFTYITIGVVGVLLLINFIGKQPDNKSSKKLLPVPRKYRIRMKNGVTKIITANKIQEPSVGKNQLSAKYYSPGDDALCYVVFLNDEKVAKYNQDIVEGWEMVE